MAPVVALAFVAHVFAETPAESYKRLEEDSMIRSGDQYPSSLQSQSPLHQAIKAEVEKLNKENPAFFNNPRWPELLTIQCAGKLGINPVAVAAAPAAQQRPAARPAEDTVPALSHNDRIRMLTTLKQANMITAIRRADAEMSDAQIVEMYKTATTNQAIRSARTAADMRDPTFNPQLGK